jgi:type I restriction enzyme M protein
MATQDFERKTKEMIDGLKAVCASYGLGNDGNEFKIITQVFLYKFLNDKFAYEVKKLDDKVASAENWESSISAMDADEFEMLQLQLELLSNLVFEACRSCGDLVGVCGFNSVFERDACDDFG